MGVIRATTAAVLLLAVAAVAAADCVTDARRISTRSAVPNLIAGPSAWSGFGLAVAKSQEGDPDAIWIAIYDEMLQPLVLDSRVVNDAGDRDAIIDLIWNGFEYGLFYRTDDAIQLQRLSISGEPLGAPLVIDPTRIPRIREDNDVAWSDALNAWVLVRHVTAGPLVRRGLWVLVVERNGSLRHEQRIASDPDSTPYLQLAVTDGGVVGVFNISADDHTLHFTPWVPGQTQFPQTKPIALAGSTHVKAAAFGHQFVATRLQDGEIRWMVLNTNGAIIQADAVLVEAEPADAVLLPYALAADNGELALTYGHTSTTNELDFRMLRFAIDGTVISDTLFSATDSRARYAYSEYPAIWSGTSWFIAAARDSETNGDSWIERYCPLTVQILAPAEIILGEPVTFSSAVSGGAPGAGYEYEWSFSRDPGGSRRLSTVNRTYTRLGPATATLTVTDSSGETETVEFEFTVEEEDDDPEPEPAKPRRRGVRK
jgi:hypothetical protein